MLEILNALGLISVIYLISGVYVTAKFYPGYCHSRQFMSELGAIGSPTQVLSPRVNNYPLAVMFCLFGLSVLMGDSVGAGEQVVGCSIIVHGIATAVAGLFAMDKDPYIVKPSVSGQMHGYAGLLIMLSLLAAQFAVLFSPGYSNLFRLFSAICLFCSVWFLWLMIRSYHARHNAGLYQRFSYGSQLLWLAGLSINHTGLMMYD